MGRSEPANSRGSVDRAKPESSIGHLDIPSSKQAEDDFDNLISGMVEEIHTCQKCLKRVILLQLARPNFGVSLAFGSVTLRKIVTDLLGSWVWFGKQNPVSCNF